MTKIALFEAEIDAPSGIQKGLVVIGVPEGRKTFQHIVMSLGMDPKHNGTIVIYQQSGDTLIADPIISTVFPNRTLEDQTKNTFSGVTLVSKIDNALAADNKFETVKLTDSDYSNSGSTLQAYIQKNFTVNTNVKESGNALQVRKTAYHRDPVDWDLFWNDPRIPDDMKEAATMKFDLDICMSNDTRDCFKRLDKELTTQYTQKKYTSIVLMGPAGGGKTEMVMNYCGLHHIPLVIKTADPLMTLASYFREVGPEDMPPIMKPDPKTVEKLAQDLNDAILNGDMDEADKLSRILTSYNSLTSRHAELVKIKTLIQLCDEYELPLVVLVDEADLQPTLVQNGLCPRISNGLWTDGARTGVNHKHSVKWIFACNPDTSNVKSFDGKFYDRQSFIQVEGLDIVKQAIYDAKAQEEGLRAGAKLAADYSEADAYLASITEDVTEITKKVHAQSATKAALKWYAEQLVNEAYPQPPVFIEGQFVKGYSDNVTLDTEQNRMAAKIQMNILVAAINAELNTLTMGKDKKNSNPKFAYKVTHRNLEMLYDLVMSYSSVRKGVNRFIFDLIPSGGRLNPDPKVSSDKDDYPQIIADTVCNKLDGEIRKMQNILFTDISDADIQIAKDKYATALHDPKVWKVKASAKSAAATQPTVNPDPAAATQNLQSDVALVQSLLDQ